MRFILLLLWLVPNFAHAAVPVMVCQKLVIEDTEYVLSFFAGPEVVDLGPSEVRRELRITNRLPSGNRMGICFGYKGTQLPERVVLELSSWEAMDFDFGTFTCDESNSNQAQLLKREWKDAGPGESMNLSTPDPFIQQLWMYILTVAEYSEYLEIDPEDFDAIFEFTERICREQKP